MILEDDENESLEVAFPKRLETAERFKAAG